MRSADLLQNKMSNHAPLAFLRSRIAAAKRPSPLQEGIPVRRPRRQAQRRTGIQNQQSRAVKTRERPANASCARMKLSEHGINLARDSPHFRPTSGSSKRFDDLIRYISPIAQNEESQDCDYKQPHRLRREVFGRSCIALENTPDNFVIAGEQSRMRPCPTRKFFTFILTMRDGRTINYRKKWNWARGSFSRRTPAPFSIPIRIRCGRR